MVFCVRNWIDSAHVQRASSIPWADIALRFSPCACLAWPQPQEVVRQLLHEWSTCPESQKGPWVAKALYDRERYCRDMAGAEFGHCKASRLIEAGRSASGTLRCVVCIEQQAISSGKVLACVWCAVCYSSYPPALPQC